MLINISRELCIGAAPCVAVAGDVFQLDDEAKAILVGPSVDDTNTRLAAEACPTRAIFLYDDNKVQIYPPVEESPRAYVEEPIIGGAAMTAPATTPAPTPTQPPTTPAA